MSDNNAERFKAVVQQIERDRDPSALVALFDESSVLDSPSRELELTGVEGARRFWQEYLDAFEQISSTFRKTHDHGNCVVLEWESAGTLPAAAGPINYRGVSIVHFDENDKVKRFATYYDSAAFLAEGSRHVK